MDTTTREYLEATKTEGPSKLSEAMAKRRVDFSKMQPVDPLFKTSIPADHHPDVLDMADGLISTAKGHSALTGLHNIHTEIIETAKHVSDRSKLAEKVEPAVNKAVKRMDDEVRGIAAQWVHFDNEVRSAIGTGASPLAAELRSIMRGLPEGERQAFARDVLASGRTEDIKALAAVSPVMLGLSAEHYSWFRDEAERLVAPQKYAERAAAKIAGDRCQRALDYFRQTMLANLTRWRTGDDAKIAELVNRLTPKETT